MINVKGLRHRTEAIRGLTRFPDHASELAMMERLRDAVEESMWNYDAPLDDEDVVQVLLFLIESSDLGRELKRIEDELPEWMR